MTANMRPPKGKGKGPRPPVPPGATLPIAFTPPAVGFSGCPPPWCPQSGDSSSYTTDEWQTCSNAMFNGFQACPQKMRGSVMELEKVLAQWDTNGDGQVDGAELRRAAKQYIDQMKHVTPDEVTWNLIFGMERTQLSYSNLALMVFMGGIGLRTVNADAATPNFLGLFVMIAGVVLLCLGWMCHVSRLFGLKNKNAVTIGGSAAWTGLMTFILSIACTMEIWFAVVAPYLERSVQVEMTGTDAPIIP